MAFPSVGILDDWNRADGPVGSNWNVLSGSGGIVSKQLKPASGSDFGMDWVAGTFGPDVDFWCPLVNLASQISLYFTTAAGELGNGYYFQLDTSDSTRTFIARVDAGVETKLGVTSINLSAFVTGDNLGFRRLGSAIEIYRQASGVGAWSLVASRTDSTYTTPTNYVFGMYMDINNILGTFNAGNIIPTSFLSRLNLLGVG